MGMDVSGNNNQSEKIEGGQKPGCCFPSPRACGRAESGTAGKELLTWSDVFLHSPSRCFEGNRTASGRLNCWHGDVFPKFSVLESLESQSFLKYQTSQALFLRDFMYFNLQDFQIT